MTKNISTMSFCIYIYQLKKNDWEFKTTATATASTSFTNWINVNTNQLVVRKIQVTKLETRIIQKSKMAQNKQNDDGWVYRKAIKLGKFSRLTQWISQQFLHHESTKWVFKNLISYWLKLISIHQIFVCINQSSFIPCASQSYRLIMTCRYKTVVCGILISSAFF